MYEGTEQPDEAIGRKIVVVNTDGSVQQRFALRRFPNTPWGNHLAVDATGITVSGVDTRQPNATVVFTKYDHDGDSITGPGYIDLGMKIDHDLAAVRYTHDQTGSSHFLIARNRQSDNTLSLTYLRLDRWGNVIVPPLPIVLTTPLNQSNTVPQTLALKVDRTNTLHISWIDSDFNGLSLDRKAVWYFNVTPMRLMNENTREPSTPLLRGSENIMNTSVVTTSTGDPLYIGNDGVLDDRGNLHRFFKGWEPLSRFSLASVIYQKTAPNGSVIHGEQLQSRWTRSTPDVEISSNGIVCAVADLDSKSFDEENDGVYCMLLDASGGQMKRTMVAPDWTPCPDPEAATTALITVIILLSVGTVVVIVTSATLKRRRGSS